MKKQLLFSFVLLLTLGFVSCSGGSKNGNSGKGKKVSNILNDAKALQKAEDALRNMPQYKGKELNIFQDVHFYKTSITVEIQDPSKPENVDHFEYENGKWSAPQPVQISGGGNMKHNTTPLNDVKFATVATVYKNWYEKANGIEDYVDNEPLGHIYFKLWVPRQQRYFSASNIETSRSEYSIDFNLDGSVKEFEKK